MAYEGYLVVLNGSGSEDPDGDPLAFSWEQVSGPPVEMDGVDTDSPEFTIPAPGTYRFELTVSDGVESSKADSVEVVVPYTVVETGDSGCSSVGGQAGMMGVLGALAGLVWRKRR